MKNSIKKILDTFAEQGVDDLKVKKEDDEIIIGYFLYTPVDCVKIKNNKIIHIVFSRQEKLKWLFELADKEVTIIDDYITA